MKATVVYTVGGTVQTDTHEAPHISISSGTHPRDVIVSCHDRKGGRTRCDHRYTDAYAVDREVGG